MIIINILHNVPTFFILWALNNTWLSEFDAKSHPYFHIPFFAVLVVAQRFKMANDFEHEFTKADEGVSIFIGIMYVLITTFGLPINISAIKLLRKHGSAQFKLIEQIPISMCICNILQMFPLYILYSICAFRCKWVLGFPFCQFMGFWVHFNANSSIWHLVAYALEQQRAVGSDNGVNLAWQNVADWKKYLTLLLVWFQGLFWSIIPFSGWCGYQFEGLGLSCSITWEEPDVGSISYTVCIFLVNFIFPTVIIVSCYFKIFTKFKNHIVNLSSPLATSAQVRNKAKLRKLAVVGCFMTGSFLFSWAPYAAVGLFMVLTQRKAHPILVSLPAVFAKCSVIIYPCFILLKKSAFKLKIGETSRGIISKINEPRSCPITKS